MKKIKNALRIYLERPLKLVRPMRVELIWISPPPPQDGASTNFATAADCISDLNQNQQIRDVYFSAEFVEFGSFLRCYFDLHQYFV